MILRAADQNQDSQISTSQSSKQLEFEKQELILILKKLVEGNLAFQDLTTFQKESILGYIKNIVNGPPAFPIRALPEVQQLTGRWRMVFSTDDLYYKLLPSGTIAYLDILDGPGEGNLNYRFLFPEELPLKEMRAESTYKVDSNGILAFQFKRILLKIFGLELPVPFGETGRSFVEISYFDGKLMIEKLEKNKSETGLSYDTFTVYLYIGPAGSFIG